MHMGKGAFIILLSALVLIAANFSGTAFAQPAVKGRVYGCLDPKTNYTTYVPCVDGDSGGGDAPSIPDYSYRKASEYPGGVAGYFVSATFNALKNIVVGPFKIMGWMLDKIFQ